MYNQYGKDILIIEQSHGMLFKLKRKFGYSVEPPYISDNVVFIAIRKIWFKYNLPGHRLFYNKKINFDKYSIINVYDPAITKDYMLWLRERCPKQRIVFTYNNPIKDNGNMVKFLKSINVDVAIWEEEAARKYNIIHCGQSYLRELVDGSSKSKKPKYDVVFFGRDKGRLERILKLENDFRAKGLKTYFHISPTHRYNIGKQYKKLIPYEEIVEYVKNTRAVLDLTQKGQTGTTMRVREALFFGIKLITDNPEVKKLSFYNRANIFILGEDNIDNLRDFIYSPSVPISEEILSEFEFENVRMQYLRRKDVK